jgi:hypothetical protein
MLFAKGNNSFYFGVKQSKKNAFRLLDAEQGRKNDPSK